MTLALAPRIGVLVTSLVGVSALLMTGALPGFAAALVMLALTTATLLPPPERERVGRWRYVALAAVPLTVWLFGPNPQVALRVSVLAAMVCAMALVLFLGMATRREMLLALGVSGMMLVLAAGVGAGLLLQVVCLAGWLSALVAIVLIVQLVPTTVTPGMVVQPRTDETRPVRPRQPLRQVAAALGLAVACGLVLFLVVPEVDSPAGSGLFGDAAGQSPDGDGAATTAPPRDGSTYVSGGVDLRTRGALPTEPLVQVPGDSPEYWRGATMDMYDGGYWIEDWQTKPEIVPAGPVTLSPPERGESGESARSQRYEVNVLPSYAGTLIAPGDVVALDSPAESARTPSGTLLPLSAVEQYAVMSTQTPSVELASAAPRDTAELVAPSGYVDLPASVPDRVLELGESLVSGAPDRASEVAAVEQYLEANAKYLLDAPVAPPDADPVDYFLFESRLGYCEHFASAEVVLLRAGGVPARLATGFVNGERTDDGDRVFRGIDGHAWVEVWMPGVGWATSDPTVGVERAEDSQSMAERVAQTIRDWFSEQRNRMVAGLALAVLLVAAVAGARWWSARRRRRGSKTGNWSMVEPPEPLAAFGRLERVLARRGRARRAAETPAELAERLPDVGRASLVTVEQACYSPRLPSDRERIAAAADLDRASRTLGADGADEPDR